MFEKPMYLPVQKKHFESIEIDIRDEFGESIPFVERKVIDDTTLSYDQESILSYNEDKTVLL